jgi:hypothetical protein
VIRAYSLDDFCKQRKPGVAGTWNGAWASSVYPGLAGSFQVSLIQTGGSLTGTITISGSNCVSGGSLTGTVTGSSISFGAIQAEKQVAFTGTVNAAVMSGTWTASGCGQDAGGWNATKAP